MLLASFKRKKVSNNKRKRDKEKLNKEKKRN